MRFLHVADLHIGKQLCGYPLLQDQEYALEQMLAMAIEHKAEALVIAGDVYDKSVPSAEAVCVFDRLLAKVSEMGLPCICVPGNHDSCERLAYAQGLLAHQSVHFPPVYDGKLASVEIASGDGTPVVFWLMPFLNPGKVRVVFPEAEIGANYTAAVSTALQACDLDKEKWNVLVAHQFVTAGGADTVRTDGEVNLGGIDNVDAGVFKDFDYVALGHVHRPQRIGRDTVRYAGSLLKYSASEARYPKSAVLVDLGAKPSGGKPGEGVSFELVPLPYLHDLREIRGTLQELLSPEVIASADADDYVNPVLTDEVPQIDAMARLQAAYPHVLGLSYEFEGSASGVDGSSGGYVPREAIDVESMDPIEAFGRFFAEQNGVEMSERQRNIVEETLQEVLLGAGAASEVKGGGAR